MPDLDASIMAALDDVRGDDNPPDDVVEPAAADPVVEDTTSATDTSADPVVDPAVKVEDKVVEPVVDENDFSTVPEKDATGRTNRIPHPRVAKMVDGAVKKATKAWETEKTSLSAQNQTYVKRLENIQQVEHAMFNDQRRFIQMLRTIPGYAELLPADGAKPAATTTAAASTTATDDPEPQPDVVENGVPVGWTNAGLAKLRAWDARQVEQRVLKAAEEKFGKPLSEFTTAKEAHDANVRQSQAIANQLNEATKWDGFVENGPEILAQLQNPANGKLSLRDIYERVMFGKLRMSQSEMRAALLAEMEKSPRSTAAGAGGQNRVAAAASSNKPLEDQIMDKLNALR